ADGTADDLQRKAPSDKPTRQDRLGTNQLASTKTVLFLCTGNYYRSRFAEILFDWQALERGLTWKACSRGLHPDRRNSATLPRSVMAALRGLRIPFDNYERFPLLVNEYDFRAAHHIVAVNEPEHRPMIRRRFPAWLDCVEFWHVHDWYCCAPEQAIRK